MENRLYCKLVSIVIIAILFLTGQVLPGTGNAYGATDDQFEQKLTAQGFPESYKVQLRKLHDQHPNWTFKAKSVGVSWADAVSKAYSNSGVNTVHSSYPDPWKSIKSGTYNFTSHTYIGKDGSQWVSASKKCVEYYMDPRNWLTEDYVFMFEKLAYDDDQSQSEAIVKKVLATTAVGASASKYYMDAGKTYGVSPVYLAVKTRIELGSSDFMVNGHSFTYGGKNYSGCYNVFNIGATDSADGSAATKGLVYAAGGSSGKETSFLRPWNSLEKAIKGGAYFISQGYIKNNQYSLYTERFNVMNGASAIGTHQYATSIFNASTQASIMYQYYTDYDVLAENFAFEIPVFDNMPASPCERPPTSGNNNCYLDTIKVSANGKAYSFTPTFNRFTQKYTLDEKLPASVTQVEVTTDKNDSSSKVTVTGTKDLKFGDNKITIKCKASSGLVTKYYYVTVNRDSTGVYIPATPKNLTAENLGGSKVMLKWTGDAKAKGYQVSYKQSKYSKWYDVYTTKTQLEKAMQTKDTVYDFKVCAYSESNGEKILGDASQVASCATFGDEDIKLSGSLYSGYMTVKLVWNEVAGADGYKVFYKRKDGNTWYELESDENQFVKKMKSVGMGYEFKVRAYKKYNDVVFLNGAESNVRRIYTLKRPAVTLEKAYTRSIRVKWTNISGESGYDVYRSESKNSGYKKIATVSYTRSSYLNEGMTLKKTYYYKVRAYKKTDYGTVVYGPYSTIASIMR